MNKTILTITEWITRFAILNLLWIGFTIIGFFVFGFFPATISMFSVVRKWIKGETDINTLSYFWKIYKHEFGKGNVFGLVIWLISCIIFIDLYYMNVTADFFALVIHIPLYLFIFAFVFSLLYFFPVYVHYNTTSMQLVKNSFLIMLIHPLHTVAMFAGIALTFFVMYYIPGLAFFFGGSFVSYLIMGTAYHAFLRIEHKQQQLHP